MKLTKVLLAPVAAAVSSAILFTAVSCSENNQPPAATAPAQPTQSDDQSTVAQGTSTVTIVPGVAGGIIDEVFTASATVSAVDPASRMITLLSPDGSTAAFPAPRSMQNFDQLRVGDKVNATLRERLEIYVNPNGGSPSASAVALAARAPKGAKPGAIVAQEYELTANVVAIDSTNRQATLRFVDGQTRVVNVRPDVDLTKYKVGDQVVIRVTEALQIIAEAA